MDRNDIDYFKRITPEFIESGFHGHNVPENIRKRVALIMRRFTIFGICDAMYIANCIAYDNGSGDGKGNFKEAEITEIKKIAKYLSYAYGCNIFKEDLEDLEQILRDGELPKDRMISGLKKSAQIRREEINNMKNDAWRIEFLHGEIGVIKDTIEREEKAS